MATLDYSSSGVDIEKADQLVSRIGGFTRKTLNRKVRSSIGGYASLYALNAKTWLAASTDGVGTKLKLAFQSGKHDSIGQDLVAMSVNDLLCVGAQPLFFLDYFATGKLDLHTASEVIKGIARGCELAGCALVGGETAEMPGFYQDGEYDLAGFAVGSVEAKKVLPLKNIQPGDVILGLASSGFHSNGYSLLRRLLDSDDQRDHWLPKLLTPTRIYTQTLSRLVGTGVIKGMAHITGSGFLNVPRISTKVSYEIELPSLDEIQPEFGWCEKKSRLSLSEMAQTFNMGVGMVLVVDKKKQRQVIRKLAKGSVAVWELGKVVRSKPSTGSEVHLSRRRSSEKASLVYGK